MSTTSDPDMERLLQQFRIICRKCGGENVAAYLETGIDYGGETGYSPGTISIGCNACRENDWFAAI